MVRQTLGWLALVLILSSCSSMTSSVPDQAACAELSVIQQPPYTEDLFRAVVTRIGEQNVSNKGLYQLRPGEYRLRLVELIDDPRLAVPFGERGYRDLDVVIEPGIRYHLVANFDSAQPSSALSYWQPQIWRESPASCKGKNSK